MNTIQEMIKDIINTPDEILLLRDIMGIKRHLENIENLIKEDIAERIIIAQIRENEIKKLIEETIIKAIKEELK